MEFDETIINKDRPKKILLAFVAFLLIVGSGVTLGRVYLKNHPLNFRTQILGLNDSRKEVESSNALIDVKTLSQTTGSSIEFGQNLTNPFSPRNTGKIYLKLIDNKNTYIGYLDQEDKFNLLHIIPLTVSNIKLYDDESIAYVLKDQKFGQDMLIVRTLSQKEYKILTLNPGEKISDIFFNVDHKAFYALVENYSGLMTLYSVDLKGDLIKIFESESLKSARKIIYANKDAIYLQYPSNCQKLDFLSKNLVPERCQQIPKNNENLNFLVSKLNISSYKIQSKVSEVIKNFAFTDILERYFFDGSYIYFNQQNVNGKKDLKRVRVGDKFEDNVALNVRFETSTLFILQGNVYVIFKDFAGNYHVIRYIPQSNPAFSNLLKKGLIPPVSYPASYPASYAQTGLKYERYIYDDWYKFSLGFDNLYGVELIYPEYFVNI